MLTGLNKRFADRQGVLPIPPRGCGAAGEIEEPDPFGIHVEQVKPVVLTVSAGEL
jgi:hypothetical protein